MKCPVCGKENPENASSCANCGAAIARVKAISPRTPRSKLAITSIVFAFLGIPLVPVGPYISEAVAHILRLPTAHLLPFSGWMPSVAFSFVGLVLGIIARVRIRRTGGRIAGSGTATAAVVLSGLTVAFMYIASPGMGPRWSKNESAATNIGQFIIRRPMGMYQEVYGRVTCKMNLSDIGLALHAYATDHGGNFPAGPTAVEAFRELAKSDAFQRLAAENEWFDGVEMFVCPGAWRDYRAWRRTKKLTEETCSYDYVPGLNADSDSTLLIAFDRAFENHWGIGRNVLFAGGYVKWMREDDFQQALAEQRGKMASATSQSGGTPQ